MNWADQTYAIGRGLAAIRHVEGAEYQHFLKGAIDAGLEGLLQMATGSTFPNVSKPQILSLRSPIPPVPEQRSIAATLSCLDDKIELNNRMNKTLEEMAQALFKSWFVDFDPVKAKMEGREPTGMDAETATLFPDEFEDSELGQIPKGWRVGSIYDIAEVLYGAPYKSTLFTSRPEGYPLIRIRDLKTLSPQFFTNEDHPRRVLVNPGDIIVGMDAEFVPCVWMGKVGVLNQRVCKFVPRNPFTSHLMLYFLIMPHMAYLQHAKVGTTVSHFGKGDVDRIRTIVPKADIQACYSKLSDNILQSMLVCKATNIALKEIRDTLLPKLMSGEIRVPEAEDILEEVL